MSEFRMPALGADMDAGTLVEWLVKPGDEVKRGQVVAVVETQKGAIEVEIWENGVVERLAVPLGTKVPVGEVLATLRGHGAPSAAAPAAAAPVAPAVPSLPSAPRTPSAAKPVAVPEARAQRVRTSPSARKLAAELGVAIETVEPGQPGAVVTREDVLRAAGKRAAAVQTTGAAIPVAADWHAQMRAAIAKAMTRSKREIPHYYLSAELDVTAMLDWLARENEKRSVHDRLLAVVPLMKAVALALREVPELNGAFVDGAFRQAQAVHLGMAISLRGGGLVAPAIHDAERKPLAQLMTDLRDLVARVRGGRLRSSEMSDPTVTLTNLGETGVETVMPVIYPPQVAIVGLGRITERPRVDEGAVVVRKVVTATLAADHRVSDGHRGAAFLTALGRLLLSAEKLA